MDLRWKEIWRIEAMQWRRNNTMCLHRIKWERCMEIHTHWRESKRCIEVFGNRFDVFCVFVAKPPNPFRRIKKFQLNWSICNSIYVGSIYFYRLLRWSRMGFVCWFIRNNVDFLNKNQSTWQNNWPTARERCK